MPNWCSTAYCCQGDKEEIDALHEMLKRMESRKNPKISNDFGNMWLGELVKELGFNWEDHDCRGSITSFAPNGDDLMIYQETAWGEQCGVRYCIQQRFPSIVVDFCDEEPGCGRFVTTSFDAFPYRYEVDNLDAGEIEEFQDAKEALEYVGEHIGRNDLTLENIQGILKDWNEDHEGIWFNKFELVDR